MFRIAMGVLCGVLCLALASEAALAQAPAPARAARMTLFISPAGEPFRPKDGGQPPLNAWFAAADADKDGKLVFAEFLGDHNRFFDIVDADKSGVLSNAENSRYEQRIAPEILGPDGPIPRPRMSEEQIRDFRLQGRLIPELAAESRTGAGRFGLINEPQPIRYGDRDFDYQITRAEWAAAARRRFDRLDTTKDAGLTMAELEPRLP